MALKLLLLFALFATLSPAGQAARTKLVRDTVGDLAVSTDSSSEEMVECLYENFYRPDGEKEDHKIAIITGFPKKNCNFKCNKLLYQNVKANVSSSKLANVEIKALEQGCLDAIVDEEELRESGRCVCKTKDGQQLVPTYGAVNSCTKENCWKFHKKIFNIETRSNPWKRATENNCETLCTAPGTGPPRGQGLGDPRGPLSCDRVILGDQAPSDAELQKLMANPNQDGLTNSQKKLRARFEAFYTDHSDKSVTMRVGAKKLEWRMPDNARCSKPCDDGSDETPYIDGTYVCFEDEKAVGDELCIKSGRTRPERQECPFLPFCRVAWSTNSGPKQVSVAGALPLNGPWIQTNSKNWIGIMISDTTLESAALNIYANMKPHGERDMLRPGGTGYAIRIEPGGALSWTDEKGRVQAGSYNEDTITWDKEDGHQLADKDHLIWVRRDSNEALIPPVVGAWVAMSSGEYKGNFDFAEAEGERTFTALSMDGTPSEARAKMDGKTIELYGQDGTKLEDKVIMRGSLKWDPDTLVDTLTWESTDDTPDWMKPSAWVRLEEPIMSDAAYGMCSQTCLPAGDEVTGKQLRTVECLVETGGEFSGKWEARGEDCIKRMDENKDENKPEDSRKCDPSPPPCGDWIVVCESKSGVIPASDSECAGTKPVIQP